jgi:SsrA-binding protein
MAAKKTSDSGPKAVVTNRKARRDYQVLETLEAGIELKGTEVKSIRLGHVSLGESYGRVEGREVYLHEMHIEPYEFGNQFNHDPVRRRRLLLHRREIDWLRGQVQLQGYTLVPLRIYFKRGRAKVALGLCRGKHQQDKRETLKRRTAEREAQRAIANARRR